MSAESPSEDEAAASVNLNEERTVKEKKSKALKKSKKRKSKDTKEELESDNTESHVKAKKKKNKKRKSEAAVEEADIAEDASVKKKKKRHREKQVDDSIDEEVDENVDAPVKKKKKKHKKGKDDVVEEDETLEGETPTKKKKHKKRKEKEDETLDNSEIVQEETQVESPMKKKKKNKTRAAESKKRKPSDDDDMEAAGEDDGKNAQEKKSYSQNIVFVGQLPYHAKVADVKAHFEKHGVFGITSVRLLTDVKTKRSRGIAFVQVENSKSMVLALRVHHTRLFGRMINVERTCGGGGKGEARKNKIDVLRSMQNKKVTMEVQMKIKEILANSSETDAQLEHFDDRAIEALGTLPRETMELIVTEYVKGCRLDRVNHPAAWLMGLIKRYREKLTSSEEFDESKNNTFNKKDKRKQRPTYYIDKS